MSNLQLRWNAASGPSKLTTAQRSKNNPLVAYIKTHKARGTSQAVMFENLMRQGYSYRNIKNAFKLVEAAQQGSLDWRSPTAINETARMIRRDIRNGQVTYSRGMRILLSARDNLKSLISNPRDRRLAQINNELRITKNLLMKQYANPLMIKQFK